MALFHVKHLAFLYSPLLLFLLFGGGCPLGPGHCYSQPERRRW